MIADFAAFVLALRIAAFVLALRIAALAPHVVAPLDHARAAGAAASLVAPAHLLLAIAYQESRFIPTAVSRVEGGRRVGGVWPSSAPAGAGPRYCGVMQTAAGHNWTRCLALRDLGASYRAGAAALAQWLAAAGGDMRRALNGYACGWAGLRRGCHGYGRAVLRLARRLGGP